MPHLIGWTEGNLMPQLVACAPILSDCAYNNVTFCSNICCPYIDQMKIRSGHTLHQGWEISVWKPYMVCEFMGVCRTRMVFSKISGFYRNRQSVTRSDRKEERDFITPQLSGKSAWIISKMAESEHKFSKHLKTIFKGLGYSWDCQNSVSVRIWFMMYPFKNNFQSCWN